MDLIRSVPEKGGVLATRPSQWFERGILLTTSGFELFLGASLGLYIHLKNLVMHTKYRL